MRFILLTLVFPLLSVAAAPAPQVGREFLLPASPLHAHDPHVATGEKGSLVVWQSGKADKADLYGCRLGENGKPLDSSSFVISKAAECQERPRVSWGKGSWLVVWADLRNDKDYDIFASRVSSEGKVLDPEGIPIAVGDHNQVQPDVAFNGQHWFVVWRSFNAGTYAGFGARVSSGGKVLDAAPINVAESADSGLRVGELRVAAAGGRWLAAWFSRINFAVGERGGGNNFHVSSFMADGKIATAQVARSDDVTRLKAPITLASNGKDAYLLSWTNAAMGGRGDDPGKGLPYGAMRLDLDGKVLGTTELGGQKIEVKQPAAAWDGKGFLVILWDGRRAGVNESVSKHVNPIVAHLVAADGKYEGKVEISSGEPNPGFAPAASGDGKGHCLVVYERHPEKAGDAILIAARLLTR